MLGGIYAMFFTGASGSGMGMLLARNGAISGADVVGAIYDGSYKQNDSSGKLEGKMRMEVPPNALLVTGAYAGPQGMKLEFPIEFPVGFGGEGLMTVQTPAGTVNVVLRKLRDFDI